MLDKRLFLIRIENIGFRIENILIENYEDIIKPISFEKPFLGKTLFLKGANSNYIKPEDITLIKHIFPNYQIESIANTGHWVHAENPLAFYNAIIRFIHQ